MRHHQWQLLGSQPTSNFQSHSHHFTRPNLYTVTWRLSLTDTSMAETARCQSSHPPLQPPPPVLSSWHCWFNKDLMFMDVFIKNNSVLSADSSSLRGCFESSIRNRDIFTLEFNRARLLFLNSQKKKLLKYLLWVDIYACCYNRVTTKYILFIRLCR